MAGEDRGKRSGLHHELLWYSNTLQDNSGTLLDT